MGGGFFLVGAIFIGAALGGLLGLVHIGGPTEAILFPLIGGLVFASAGLWDLSKAFDSRPVIVIDGEGLFYRPHGGSIVPWRDIQTVKRDTHSRNDRLILGQQSGPQVIMDLRLLHRGFGEDPISDAIMEAWQSHGGANRLSRA
jgi:hypothetical protein